MRKRKVIVVVNSLLIPFTVAFAEVEKSLSAELPTLALSLEIRFTATPNDYFSTVFYVGPDNTYGAGINWTRSITSNQAHWLGLG